jgi:nicotinamide mononucleotide adenylyltransferase
MRRSASEVLRSLERRIARLERQASTKLASSPKRVAGRRNLLAPNDVEKDFYDGFVEDVIDVYERGDDVVFGLIETDEGYAIIRESPLGHRKWDLENRYSTLRDAESDWEDMVEEFDEEYADWD